jgi:hypothetical protein
VHTHRHGVRFRIWAHPNEPCVPGEPACAPPADVSRLVHVSTEYTDPLQLRLDPPWPYDGADVACVGGPNQGALCHGDDGACGRRRLSAPRRSHDRERDVHSPRNLLCRLAVTASLGNRILRATRLDPKLYEEVEADANALGQAAGVVVLSSLAAGVGTIGLDAPAGFFVGTVAALLGWVVWAYATYLIGTRILPEPQTAADVRELLRTTGFASAPGLIRVLGVVPVAGPLAFPIAAVWMIVAMVIAVRQALDYESTGRAVAVCVLAFVAQLVVVAIVIALLGKPAAS